jgi:anaerobic ribonucleoside-triphosphate reductase
MPDIRLREGGKRYFYRRSSMSNNELKVPVEVYSRVVGYFRPINQWNKGKQEEFRDRKVYRLEKAPAYEYQGNL